MRRSRLVLSTAAALALVAAACGGSADEPTGGEVLSGPGPDVTTTIASVSSTSAAPAPTASFRGVSAESIKVGILAYDWDRLAELGVEFGVSNSGDLYVAALEEINDRGGVHGRRLEPVLAEFLPVGSLEADQACVELTEDHEVFVVIGVALNEQILCFTEIHETAAVVVDGMNEERMSRAAAPYATVMPAHDVRAAGFVEVMTEAGVLTDEAVGVIGSADVSESNFRSMVAALRDAGHAPVEGLIGGNAEDLAQSARDQSIIYQRLDDAGVTVAISTTGVPLEIANAMEAGYEPEQWLLSTLMSGRGLTDAGVPHAYLDGALAVVSTPTGTVDQPRMGDDPLISACIDDLRARTEHPLPYELEPAVNNITAALIACALADILEAALLNAGTDLTNATFQSGLEAVGDIELAGYQDADLGPGNLGAAKGIDLVRFDARTGAWAPVN